MKKLFNTLSIVVYVLGTALTAQTDRSAANNARDQVQLDQSNSKVKFVSDQNYLSSSAYKDFTNSYGDSLKGFNEAAVKVELISRGYLGQEFVSVMAWRKRDYINARYKLGDYAPKPLQPTAPAPSKKSIGGGNMTNVLPCVNEDFEATTPGAYNNVASPVSGWSVQSTSTQGKQLGCGLPTNAAWINGSPEFSIVSTPVIGHPYIGNLPNSPLGGNNVALLGNTQPGFVSTRISTQFPVTQANKVFQFAYAGSWDGTGHCNCDQPFFMITLMDCTGQPLSCATISLTPPNPICPPGTPNPNATGYSITNGVSWTNWQLKYIDLTPYIGGCITLQITNGDCNGGAHHGSLYFDAKCGGNVICSSCVPASDSVSVIKGPVSFCSGSGIAQINAPNGYATYSWVAPPPPAAQIPVGTSTLQFINIPNPTPGDVYTVYLTSPSGCQFVSTNTIVFTSVSVDAIGASPSCPGGASGSATVIGHGSGTGYTYTWTNSSNNVVGSSSVVTNLAPGVYSVTLSGLGAAGCGSAVASVTVGIKPLGLFKDVKLFCPNSPAVFATNGGSNYQWYNGPNGITPIPPNLGGTLPTHTISNPVAGQVITMTRMFQGCQDSIRYTLGQTAAGFVSTALISSVCVGGTNGTAQVSLTPSQGSPSGLNFINVTSTGATPPFNMNTVGSPQVRQLALTGLAAGSYSVSAFDGSCFYGSSFNVNAFAYTFNLTPSSASLCSGGSVAGSVSFNPQNLASRFTYAWYPNNGSIFGPTTPAVILKPSIPQGPSVTIVYTVVVTPTAINCPETRTVPITVYNPVTPTITAIPPLCNNSAPFQILVSPVGGTFNINNLTGPNSPIGQGNGIINPAHVNLNPLNAFTYSISEYLCKASATATFEVSKYINPALTTTVPFLCVNSPAFNLNNIVQNPGGTWSMVTPNVPGSALTNGQFIPGNLGVPLTVPYSLTYKIPSVPNPTACPSTTTTPISVTNTLVPNIPSVPDFCTSSPQQTLAATPTGGGWTPISGALQPNGVLTPGGFANVHKAVATYSVKIGPCVNTNTTQLTIHKFNSAALTGLAKDMCYNSQPMNLMSIVQSTTGSWTSADPTYTTVQNNFFSPANLPTGKYTVKYTNPSSPDPNICPDNATLSINVLNPPAPTITQIGPFCNNAAPLQLTVTPNKGAGQWVASSFVDKQGKFTPANTTVGKNNVQYIMGTSTCFKEHTIQVDIEAFVPATIVSALPDLCNNGSVINLAPFTLSNLGTWSGTGITGTNFNPASTGSGKFTLTYKTNSASGLCPDQAAITVNVYSLATPVVAQEGPFCNTHAPLQLRVSPVGGIFGGGNMGLVSHEGIFNPGSAIIGNNVITYSVTSGPCVAYVQSTIKVEKFVSAELAKYVGPFCGNEEAVNLDSYVKNPGGTWSQADNETGLTNHMFHPSAAIKGGAFNHLTYRTNPSGLCPDEVNVLVEVRHTPEARIVVTPNSNCLPVELSFNVKDKNTGNGVWSIGDGSEPVKGLAGTHIFKTPGTYTVQFNYTDDIGCKAPVVLSQEILVHGAPKADFTVPDEIYISDAQVQLSNQSSDVKANSYNWTIPGVLQSKEMSPFATFTKSGKYQVNLEATSAFGCKDNITKTIEVKNNFNIFIPNSFSPNFDGVNDVFIPVYTKEGMDLKNYDLEIFDRWGHSLFRSRDITKGWDGMNKAGEPLKPDTYIYKMKYKDAEGNSYDKLGNITLIR